MRFKIEPDSINYNDMKSKLEAKFPDYKFKERQPNFLVAAKSGVIGTNILLRKKRLIVVGNFPTIGGSMLFMISIFISALISVIVYLIAFHPKMKKLEREIGAYLSEEYNLTK